MLTPAERKALKAKAHKLEPTVRIGTKGLTDEVIAETERALRAHELIKVRAGGLERAQRGRIFAALCERTGAEALQQVGKILVAYRRRPPA